MMTRARKTIRCTESSTSPETSAVASSAEHGAACAAVGADEWPTGTKSVSRVGGAWVVQGEGDFGPQDLEVVRGRFPGRRVTLDGDVITVWPEQRSADVPRQHPQDDR